MVEHAQRKTEQMRTLRDELLADTTLPLAADRREHGWYPVIGEGNHDADIMFVGEAPGKTEAETGRPFAGAAGRLLNELLASIDVPRESVYIANVLKDRPPNNRDPLPEEIAAYVPYLDRQIEIIQPNVIATLGRFAMGYILKRYGAVANAPPMTHAHGTQFAGETPAGQITIVPLYHPAAALYNGSLRETLFTDFHTLQQFIDT